MRSSSVCLSASLLLALGVTAQQRRPEPERAPESEAPVQRPKDAAALFAAFAAMPGLEARYTEEKHLALLAVPLTSAGRLYFLQPGYLARVVEKPEPSKLLITPDKLRMADRDGVEVIDLQQSERLRLFVTSLVRVFRGDRAALTEHYSIEYTPSPDDPAAWTLALAPKRAPLDHMMKSLTLRGKGVAVTGFELVEPNGDRTVTKIIAADPEREFSVAEKTELFGIEVGERAR